MAAGRIEGMRCGRRGGAAAAKRKRTRKGKETQTEGGNEQRGEQQTSEWGVGREERREKREG